MQVAFINPNECIGCSRCVPYCPVDAIVGANKFLHTIIAEQCIGCNLCVEPCPVDCITVIPIEVTKEEKILKAKEAKKNYTNRLGRIKRTTNLLLPPLSNDAEAIKDAIKKIIDL